jgi:hypothetical protein
MHKLLFKFEGGWCMLQTSQQVGSFGPFWVVQAALKLH